MVTAWAVMHAHDKMQQNRMIEIDVKRRALRRCQSGDRLRAAIANSFRQDVLDLSYVAHRLTDR
jgi:hypothetical protein